MELTALEFAKLIHDLKCDVRPGERRENPRAPCRAKATVIPVVLGTAAPRKQQLWVKDISRTGLGLTSSTKLDENSRILVLLPKTSTETFVLLCEIVRVVRMPGNTYVMGARMIRRCTDQEYEGLLVGQTETIFTLSTAA